MKKPVQTEGDWPDALPPIGVKRPLLESSPSEKQGPEAEHLRLEFERLRLDRQRLAIETRLKRQELRQSSRKAFKDWLVNPFILAILGGVLTIVASIISSSNTAIDNRAADESRAKLAAQTAKQTLEADLIKRFLDTPTQKTVRDNLTFLADANLIPDYADSIRSYLKNNSDAALPSLSTLVWRSPASALDWAAEGVKHGRIGFAIYRNLLRAALAQQDAGAHQIAFRSIRDVLQPHGDYKPQNIFLTVLKLTAIGS